jgi:hypothetical protein
MQQNAIICGLKSFILLSRSLSNHELPSLCNSKPNPLVKGLNTCFDSQQQGVALGDELSVSEMLQGDSLARAFRHASTATTAPSRVNNRSSFLADIWNSVGTGAHAG